MVKVFPIVGSILSIVSLILLAVGASTSNWISLEQSEPDYNPIVINSKQGTLQKRIGTISSTNDIRYSVASIGLWFGCFKEHKAAVSCSYIGSGCHSDVCWLRKTPTTTTKTCLDSKVVPLTSCVAYQLVRVFITIGIVLMVIGVVIQLVSIVTVNRSLAMLAGLIVFTVGLFVMSAFAIFYSEEWAKTNLSVIGRLGYSFYLVSVSWPLILIAGLISCCAASMGLRHKETSDYSTSNY